MKVKMLQDMKAAANEDGNVVKVYKNGEIINCDKEWQKVIAFRFIENNSAIEVKIDSPKETKAKKKVTKKKATKKKAK